MLKVLIIFFFCSLEISLDYVCVWDDVEIGVHAIYTWNICETISALNSKHFSVPSINIW